MHFFRENALCAFDCLVIMMQASIGEAETQFARLCKEFGQPVVFVRSKCDQSLRDKFEDGFIEEMSQKTADELVKYRKIQDVSATKALFEYAIATIKWCPRT